jgi:outer membrane beta-barrel protein
VTKFTKDLRLQVAEKGTDKTDLADAGALIGTGQIGVRFTPFYGKFSVASELPLHFNFYFNAGVGVAMVKYNGIIGCAADIPGGSTGCPGAPDDPAAYFAETKPAIAGNIGGGLRLYITKLVSARVEFRDVIFQDRYYSGLTLDKAASTRSTLASSPGITHVPLLMLGVGFLL